MGKAITIRKSRTDDVERLLEIYTHARAFMRLTGNMSQWPDSYPDAAILRRDIAAGVSYAVEAEGRVVATFAFIPGDDPTYKVIEGTWLNDRPYSTIHRLASDGTVRGIADRCLNFCLGLTGNIRIDTHADNRVMREWMSRRGFSYCGIIHLADGSPRLAYQLAE